MRKLLLLLPIIVLVACGENTQDEDTTAPSPPLFVTKSADTLLVETGIDATANGIFLEWYFVADPDDDLAGVQIYRSTHPDSLFLPLMEFGAPLFVPAQETWHIDNDGNVLPGNQQEPLRHYYFLRAIDNSGNLSVPSDTGSYRLWYPPENISFTSDGENYDCHIELYLLDLTINGVLLKFSDGHNYHFVTLTEELLQVMNYTVPVAELPLFQLDSLNLRVDILVQDEIEPYNSSNPDEYPLSGSESDWINLIF